MINTTSNKPQVYKLRLLADIPDQPWVVNHWTGTRRFSTWEEAIAFALQPPVTYNTAPLLPLPRGYGTRHEENVWRAKHGLEMT